MTGNLSNYTKKLVLEQIVGKNPSATVYIALLTSAPTDASTGSTIVEPSTSNTGYARKATSASDWNTASVGEPTIITNATAQTFPLSLTAWGTITHFAICDAPTGGNMLGWAPVDNQQVVGVSNTLSYPINSLTLGLKVST